MPKHLSFWSLPAWMLPELIFAGMFLYALWVDWCFR
jgi:hypothetical protein